MGPVWIARTVFLVVLASSCHTATAPTREWLRVHARLEHFEAGRFRLSLRLSRPLTRLAFTRPGDGDRLRAFHVLEPPSARVIAHGAEELLVASAPFDFAVLEISAHRHLPDKDHAPFFPLSGGGVFVYTGQLDVGDEDKTDVHYEFVPLPGEFTSLPGRVARGTLRGTASGDGTYVAFTRAPPVDHARYVAVVDPGFPAWLRDDVSALLPRLFEHFAQALKRELPERPAVLLSYGEAKQAGTISLKGGTLPALLQLDVELGSEHRAANDAGVVAKVRVSVAHESAHLWNNRLVQNSGPSWVHEGGADLLAWAALRSLRLLSREGFDERLSWAASECAMHRGTQDLAADSVRAGYSCGAVVQAVASAGPGVETVWAALLARARADGRYDAGTFFAVCEQAGADPVRIEAARQLTREGSAPAPERVAAALRAAGFAVAEGVAPADFQRADSRSAQGRWLAVRSP